MTDSREFHPAANIFPMMGDDAFGDLVNDIINNGLHEPILLHPDGRIVDGRNRYKACLEAGVEPVFDTWRGDGSLVEYVISLNLHRRHLDSSQRAAVAVEILPALEAEARERMSAGGKGTQRIADPCEAREQAARICSTNRQYVSDAKKLKAESPEVYEAVRRGEKTIPQARREVRHTETAATAKRITGKECAFERVVESGIKFTTVYADPAWSYGNQGTRAATNNHYATMSVDEICALPVADVVGDNAHLYLWTTNAFLRDSFTVIESWGFEYKSVLIWCKPQMGIGNYFRVSHEYLMFAMRGNLPFGTRSQMSWTVEDRQRHSQKPQAFRQIIETASPGPYLEMFARQTVPGWVVWGNEVTEDLFYEQATVAEGADI